MGVPKPAQRYEQQANGRAGEIGPLLLHLFATARGFRKKIDLDGAFGGLAQAQPNNLSKEMRAPRQFFTRKLRVNLHVAEGIEVIDVRLDLLLKEAIRVRDDRGAAREQDARGKAAALLPLVEIDRTGNLSVETGHHVADDLADAGLSFVFGLLVGPAQRHEAVRLFHVLRFEERHVELRNDALRDGVAGNGDRTREDAVLFQKQKIGRARPEIDDHGASLNVTVVVTDRVVECHRGHIHDVRPQSAGFHAFGEFFDDVTLDGQQHDLQLPLRVAPEQLIIPNDFIDGEGDVLLGLILDNLRDL